MMRLSRPFSVPRPVLSFPLVPRPPSQAPAPSAAIFPALLPVSSPFGLPRRPPHSLRRRGCPLERAAARVCREAGARVTCNTRLADMNLQVDRVDDRRLEVTLVSPLSGSGQPCRRGGRVQGAALALARRRERTYPPLGCVEVGGRWSDEAASFVRALVPVRLRSSLVAVLVARWSALLSHAAMSAFAATFTGRGHSAMPTVRSRPWVNFLQMQVRRPSPLAGCLPASCTSHSRWPPGYPVPGGSP